MMAMQAMMTTLLTRVHWKKTLYGKEHKTSFSVNMDPVLTQKAVTATQKCVAGAWALH